MQLRLSILVLLGTLGLRAEETPPLPPSLSVVLESSCYDCHDDIDEKGGLNLLDTPFDLEDKSSFERWEKVFDKVSAGEMPPDDREQPPPKALERFLQTLSERLVAADRGRIARQGRATVRRLNRYEYENSLRALLAAPWLQVADRLPEDGTAHLFNKVGTRLDVSHVQMAKYLEAGEAALREALSTAAYPAETHRFYIREEPTALGYLWYRPLQHSATRAAIPLLGITPQPEILLREKPVTVGAADPATREREALGFFSGTYAATTKYDFTRMQIPVDGRYKLRLKSYTFRAGLNGRSGGTDEGLTTGRQAWWRPNRAVAFPGLRSEPVTLYALAPSGESRWLTAFDAQPAPSVVEREVNLKKGEGIRPDASRLVRTRPGWRGNPNASEDGVPGLAINWLEVEGPLHDSWPPASYEALFADLPFEVTESDGRKHVLVRSDRPRADARRLLSRFLLRATRQTDLVPSEVDPYLAIFEKARELGAPFTEAMVNAFTAVLCAPDFLYLETRPGELPAPALASRLSYFLWNGPPDESLLHESKLTEPSVLRRETERLLRDSRARRFRHAFLDYWLDLRDLTANTPDATLYPDYYLDSLLTESSLRETRRFFRELIARDLPARNLVDSDFAFVNERLARHYGLPAEEGVNLRKVRLPGDSPRGGLLTQASVLRVTANGTTTSPVIRGAWAMERLMGVEIPPPPSGVDAIEPDTRGAVTIREQLEKHRATASCAACHRKFDPAGFALESFDVAGGWRDRYRAIGGSGSRLDGIGKNGHLFKFQLAQPVDCSGKLDDGRRFSDIRELKALLAAEERQVARNLVHRLVVYATGAPVSFADRADVESILDRSEANRYGVRSLIHEIVQSRLFRRK